MLYQCRRNAEFWAKRPFPYEDQNERLSKEQRQERRREAKREIDALIQDPGIPKEIIEDGAIQRWHFATEDGSVLLIKEKLLQISITDKKPFETTKFLADFQERCASWEDKTPKPCVEALQLELARLYLGKPNCGKDNAGHYQAPSEKIQDCYESLWAMQGGETDWNRIKDERDALVGDEDPEKQPLRKILREILDNWNRWKRFTADNVYINKRNSFASTHEGYYREPPADAKYLLVDRNDKLVIYLDPSGIENAYGPEAKGRMEEDVDSYYAIRKPTVTDGGRRWRGDEHFVLNPHQTQADCGTDYYGSWHATGHPEIPPQLTSDIKALKQDEEEVLLEYLRGAHGCMNRLVDHLFGIHEPELQQEYRDVYKAIPEEGRLPPTSDEEDETFTLKAILRNRQTYEHVDQQDWYGGLVGLIQTGTFTGGALCFNQLRLKLNGYRSGAVVLFRGNLLKHFVQPCKLAFAFYGIRATPTTTLARQGLWLLRE